jgi:hypothetical protein
VKEEERERDGADGNGYAIPCLAHKSETEKGREGMATGRGDLHVIGIGEGRPSSLELATPAASILDGGV